MAGQGEIVRPALRATGNSGQVTNTSLYLYNTLYNASYGRENFTPQLGHHYGTGYAANLRPVAHYRPSLDLTDNPWLGLFLRDSFTSQTKRHYRPYSGPGGSKILPHVSDKPRESGYLQLKTRPKTSMSLQTEYAGRFVPHNLRPTGSWKYLTEGQGGESGFTVEKGLELNTFLPKDSFMGEPRQTGSSVTREDFLPISFYQGMEVLPSLVSHTSRETGFTRDTVAPLACPTSLLTLNQRKDNAPAVKSIGKKECSGFVRNAPPKENSSFYKSHFLTNYQKKFCDHVAVDNLRCKWINTDNTTEKSNSWTRHGQVPF